MENITVDWLKNRYAVKTDNELSEKMGVPRDTIRTWKQRGVPKNIKLSIAQNELQVNTNIIRIPKLSVTASAGGGNNLDGIDTFEENGVMVIDADTLKVSTDKLLKSVQVNGYSMVPMLFPDSWVVFDDSGEYKGEGLYVLNWDNTLMVKLLQLSPDGKLEIISVNKDYKSYTIERNSDSQLIFYIVGKVVRIIT